MENKILSKLVEKLNMTNLEGAPDEYVLTKDEEDFVLANELLSLKQYKSWKMKGLGYTDIQIIEKLSSPELENEINREETLKRANSNKLYGIWQSEQRLKEKEDSVKKKEELKESWTAKNMYRLMQWTSENIYGKKLILNKHNKHFITTLCFFLSHDSRLLTELGYSMNKGLLIRGAAGLGKTYIPQCVEKNEYNPLSIISMLEISSEIQANGIYEPPITDGVIYLDDVGSEEPVVNHFGTKINFFKNFIETLYLKNRTFSKLIISTNINFAEIEARYGFRVRSRIKDMFNIIDVKGSDMRG